MTRSRPTAIAVTDPAATLSVIDRTHPCDGSTAPVFAAHFLGETAVFVLGEEALVLAGRDGEQRRIDAPWRRHPLGCAADGERVITGGDDGKLVATDAKGESQTLATDAKRRWIDQVALGPDGAVAWSAGKTAFVHGSGKDEENATVRGAVHRRRAAFPAQRLAPCRSRTTTALRCGFRTRQADAGEARMEGLASRCDGQPRRPIPRHRDAGADAAWLAACRPPAHAHVRLLRARHVARLDCRRALARDLRREQIILWPFHSQGRPDGQAAASAGAIRHRVEVVACHPKQDIVAAGYEDGMVLLVRLEDGAEILAKKPGEAPVTALAWSADGLYLVFGAENGEAGILDLT